MGDKPQSLGLATRIVSTMRLVAFYAFSALFLFLIIVVAWVDRRSYYPLVRCWALSGLRIFGIRVEGVGAENLEQGTDYVLAANHRSHFDAFAIMAVLGKRETRWVAKHELGRVPLFGFGLRVTGQIMVDRANHDQAVAALKRNLGKSGASVVFFAEGERSHDTTLLPFRKGAAAFAIASGFPIVPVAVAGSHRVLPKYSWMVRPGTIRVCVGEPINVDGMADGDRGPLTERLRRAVLEMLVAMEPEMFCGTEGEKHDHD